MIEGMECGRKLWILMKRHDLPGHNDYLQDVVIHGDCDSQYVQHVVRESFGLHDDNLILKLRNQRGCLIPINAEIIPNARTSPYILEVVTMYQNVKPKPRTIHMPSYNETLRSKLENLFKRVERLESITPELKYRRNSKLQKEMLELERKLHFLNNRMDQAESSNWKGMFKRHPLW